MAKHHGGPNQQEGQPQRFTSVYPMVELHVNRGFAAGLALKNVNYSKKLLTYAHLPVTRIAEYTRPHASYFRNLNYGHSVT